MAIDYVEKLIAALQAIDKEDAIKQVVPDSIKESDGSYSEDDLHPLVQEALIWACEGLITNRGQANYEAIRTLDRAGYTVRPGEMDSFGWLTGVIATRKGEIVFG